MISTHVLDTAAGCPAAGLRVMLQRWLPVDGTWMLVANAETDANGRIPELIPSGGIEARRYRLVFETGEYFASQNLVTFYPVVSVVFDIGDPTQHYHVPLLLSPFGYSTYRGS